MKIVVIGGTGQVGAKLVPLLRERGHDAVAASPSTGVDAVTGEGLAAVLEGAQVVVDATNPRTSTPGEFFTALTRTLLRAEKTAGVGHHVLVSIVGVDQLSESEYLGAKLAEERIIEAGEVPFTIVRATQFFEFVAELADRFTADGKVRVSRAGIQPVAVDDVVTYLADVATGAPAGTVEIGGPERFAMADLFGRWASATGDGRPVVEIAEAVYAGAAVKGDELTPGEGAYLGKITLDEWLGA